MTYRVTVTLKSGHQHVFDLDEPDAFELDGDVVTVAGETFGDVSMVTQAEIGQMFTKEPRRRWWR